MSAMRKLFCLLCTAVLVITACAAFAEATETGTPDDENNWANQSLPYVRLPAHIEIVPYDELPPVAEGQHHYLLLCVDHWDRDPRPDGIKPPTYSNGHRQDMYGNTDGIVLLTLDTRAKRIMLTSFIRDAIIRKPDEEDGVEHFGRINYVYNDLGPEMLCRVISQHIGVRVEKYILFTFNQIADIVDYMGGVEIDLKYYEIDYLRRYAVPPGTVTDPNGRDIRSSGRHPEGTYTFKTTSRASGTHKTGGHSAVIYMRIRKAGGGGDFQRTQRVRTVLSTLADKCRVMTWEEAEALANNIMTHNNKTNMNLAEVTEAAGYAYQLRDCTIEELRIPTDGAVRRINFADMMAEEVNWPVCREKMANFLQNSWLVMDDDDDE